MPVFDVYTFQFSPIIYHQLSLFDSAEKISLAMSEKNATFEEVFKSAKFIYRNRELLKRELLFENDIFIFKLAPVKHIKIEQNFDTRIEAYNPSVYVIIYNDKDVQRIAIEQNPAAFVNSLVVARALQKAYSELLRKHGLNISINKEYKENEFWSVIDEYDGEIQMIRFEFDYPNLPRNRDAISEIIKNASASIYSTKTKLEFNSPVDAILNLDRSNETLNMLNKASSNTGVPITVKVKGFKRHVKTGESAKTTMIDEFEIINGNTEQLRALLSDE